MKVKMTSTQINNTDKDDPNINKQIQHKQINHFHRYRPNTIAGLCEATGFSPQEVQLMIAMVVEMVMMVMMVYN